MHIAQIAVYGAILAVIMVFALSGCGSVQGAIEKARGFHDTEAQVVKSANCAVSLGGMIRGYSEAERVAGEVLCRGSMVERP